MIRHKEEIPKPSQPNKKFVKEFLEAKINIEEKNKSVNKVYFLKL